jgi:hypothetical protein
VSISRLVVPALVTSVIFAAAGSAAAQTDSTLEVVQQRLRNAMQATKDAPLSQNQEASQVITALRSSGDKDLLPLFAKMQQSKSLDNQIYAMVASAILAKSAGMDPESPDFKYVDLKVLFASKDSAMVGAALASLIDAQAMSVAQLRATMTTAPEAAHRAMAAGELNRIQKLEDRAALGQLLKDEKPIVRYYAAVTMLSGSDDEQKAGLAALKELTDANDLRQAPVQALMLVRMQKENITGGIPWAAQIAADEKADEGLRYTALAALMALKAPQAPAILGDMLGKQKDAIQQVKLGLISLENAAALKRELFDPLVNSKSALARDIGLAAQKAAAGGDNTADLLALIKQGHPIVLDWAMAYSDRAPAERRLAVRTVLVNQATIVDNQRGRDFERAALAAEKMMDEDGDAGRKVVSELLKSETRAALEATLAGIYRSTAKNQSELVLRIWDGLNQTDATENAANYAALILAREGHQEALARLSKMFMPGTALGPGFRALAGWYYAKLKGQNEALLKAVLAD